MSNLSGLLEVQKGPRRLGQTKIADPDEHPDLVQVEILPRLEHRLSRRQAKSDLRAVLSAPCLTVAGTGLLKRIVFMLSSCTVSTFAGDLMAVTLEDPARCSTAAMGSIATECQQSAPGFASSCTVPFAQGSDESPLMTLSIRNLVLCTG